MSKIKNGVLDQYGAEPFEQQQLGIAGVEGVKLNSIINIIPYQVADRHLDYNKYWAVTFYYCTAGQCVRCPRYDTI